MDPFEVLNISKQASKKEIENQYKKLAKIYHPDKTQQKEKNNETFLKIQKAYEDIDKLSNRDSLIEEIKEKNTSNNTIETMNITLDEVLLGTTRKTLNGETIAWHGYRNPQNPYVCKNKTKVQFHVIFPEISSTLHKKIYTFLGKVFKRYKS